MDELFYFHFHVNQTWNLRATFVIHKLQSIIHYYSDLKSYFKFELFYLKPNKKYLVCAFNIEVNKVIHESLKYFFMIWLMDKTLDTFMRWKTFSLTFGFVAIFPEMRVKYFHVLLRKKLSLIWRGRLCGAKNNLLQPTKLTSCHFGPLKLSLAKNQ